VSIEIKDICKSFNNFRALDHVNLTVPTGQLVALLGPSGSGKTTLLRIIAGLEHPDEPDATHSGGSIRFHDEDVADRSVRDRRVGFVFQHYALFRHMTVFENVAFGLRVRPRKLRPSGPEIAKRVHDLLSLIQLEGLANRFPSQLSGGQRQRVALARALAVEPNVLLLDEPFGALDAKVRKELRTWLRRLHDEVHVTSVFVTHDQDEALEVADQVVVMNRGRIEQTGTPEEVFHHPKTEFVINFLGEVNQFHGRVEGGNVHFGSIELPVPGASGVAGGGSARVFVRPHEVTIDTKSNGLPNIPAEVLRVHSAGPIVRVDLRTSAGQTLIAELSQERFPTMHIEPGSRVFVRPRHIRVFGDTAGHAANAPPHTDQSSFVLEYSI
jgi:sulfate transport system ATP-binding protein